MTTEQARARIDLIYSRLPRLECQGKCQGSCGPIAMSRAEWTRIIERLGYAPKGNPSLVCPMLCKASGKCSVYDIRPLICRLWGMVKAMPCPWGCNPSRWVSDKEAAAMLAKLHEIEVDP
jgi:Fe-S-cluster containining protein